jgi:hypothetical protein
VSTYAELDDDNIVVNIIVADSEFVATQTDKNYVEYTNENPAGIGYTYDAVNDVFIAPPNTYADRWRNILLERRRTNVGRHLTRWLTPQFLSSISVLLRPLL